MIKFQQVRTAFKLIIDFWKRTGQLEKLYRNNKWHECIAECKSLIQSGSSDFWVYYYLGLSYHKLNLIDESTQYLEQGLKMLQGKKPDETTRKHILYIQHHLIHNLRKQRDYPNAIIKLNQNIEENSDYIPFYLIKANIYEELDEIDQSIRAVSDGLAIEPGNKELDELRKHFSYSYSLKQSEKRNGG
ncbi:MAG: hypothetical protein HRT61_11860 [Ekhidna sp.]|nr:hypothetical protein [Ekhidna sp.]